MRLTNFIRVSYSRTNQTKRAQQNQEAQKTKIKKTNKRKRRKGFRINVQIRNPVTGSSAIPKEPAKIANSTIFGKKGIKRKMSNLPGESKPDICFQEHTDKRGPIYTADVYRGGFFRDSFLSF